MASRRPSAVMLSKRACVFYLEHARVLQKDGRVVWLTDRGDDVEHYFNLPDKNTTFLLLGKGTSITDAAMRLLAQSSVMVGFCGSGGTPLSGALDISFVVPQDEYRPTEYMQAWARMWFDETARLKVARRFLRERTRLTQVFWEAADLRLPEGARDRLLDKVETAATVADMLSAEALWAKSLYGYLANTSGVDFRRQPARRATTTPADVVNGFLDHGNYMAYGYAAVALHGLGISFAFPVLHGKTRRGALVFDVADLVKDGWVMPMAFRCAKQGASDQEFRQLLLEVAQDRGILDHLFAFIVSTIEEVL